MPLKTLALALAIVVLYALHQDVWFWRTARPLVFGFLPVGLAYHGAYCIASALLDVDADEAWPGRIISTTKMRSGRSRRR